MSKPLSFRCRHGIHKMGNWHPPNVNYTGEWRQCLRCNRKEMVVDD